MQKVNLPFTVVCTTLLILCLLNVPATNAAGGYEVKFARELLSKATTALNQLTALNSPANQNKVRDLLYLTDLLIKPVGQCGDVVLDVMKDIGPARSLITAATNLAAAHRRPDDPPGTPGIYANAQQNDAADAVGGTIGAAVINKLTADLNLVAAAGDKTFTSAMCEQWADLRSDAAYQNTAHHFIFKRQHKRLLHTSTEQHVLQAAGDSDVNMDSDISAGIDAIAEGQFASEAEAEAEAKAEVETELMTRLATEHLVGAPDLTAKDPPNRLGTFVSLLMNALFFDALRLGAKLLEAPANIHTDPGGFSHSYIYFPWTGADGNSCQKRFGYEVTGNKDYCMVRGYVNCATLFANNDPNNVALNRNAAGTIERCIAFAPRRPWWNNAGTRTRDRIRDARREGGPAAAAAAAAILAPVDAGGDRFSFEDGIIPLMVVQYNTAKFRPNWVAWRISKHVIGRYGGRAEYFRPAPESSADVHSAKDQQVKLANDDLIATKFKDIPRKQGEKLADWLWRCLKATSTAKFKTQGGEEMFSYDHVPGSISSWVDEYIFQRRSPTTKAKFHSVWADLEELGWTRGHIVGSGMMGGGGIRALSTFTFINIAINHAPYDNNIWEEGSEKVVAAHVQNEGQLFHYAVTGCSPSADAEIGSISTVAQFWDNAGNPAATHPLSDIDGTSPALTQFYVPKYMFSYVLAPDGSKSLFSYCQQKLSAVKLVHTDSNKNLKGVITSDCKTALTKKTIGTAWSTITSKT